VSPEEFATFHDEAVHALMRLNEACETEFHLASWPRWDYDFDRGTLTFSQDGVAKVVASIQVVGTTSEKAGTWLWGWANSHLPVQVTERMKEVRAFGETEKIPELTNPSAPDDEYLGWKMTAVAAAILGSKGAYRCPGTNGFVYLVYTDLSFADLPAAGGENQIRCSTHGVAFDTYVCEHLISNPAQEWFSEKPSEDKKWPDAWCATCDLDFQEEGEWTDANSAKLKAKLLCHHCYESFRSKRLPSTPPTPS
jgi:hypothetical protein